MTVKCIGRFRHNNRWEVVAETEGEGGRHDTTGHNHAEQKSFRALVSRLANFDIALGTATRDKVFAFVQNCYPCDKCRAFFEEQSKKCTIVFVLSEPGAYFGDWDIVREPVASEMPQLIFLRGGSHVMPGYVKVTHVRIGSTDFPAMPSVSKLRAITTNEFATEAALLIDKGYPADINHVAGLLG